MIKCDPDNKRFTLFRDRTSREVHIAMTFGFAIILGGVTYANIQRSTADAILATLAYSPFILGFLTFGWFATMSVSCRLKGDVLEIKTRNLFGRCLGFASVPSERVVAVEVGKSSRPTPNARFVEKLVKLRNRSELRISIEQKGLPSLSVWTVQPEDGHASEQAVVVLRDWMGISTNSSSAT